ncbi:ArsC/Spx/MgsR family protein [Pantanalinema rosaneae CENA516]|uniref:ArsC/Spx/MgsR family protein n=1 Tax=Pantanalinema rosaneae TaxID=1620701 RepID=UPI003D6F1287
MATVIFYEKPGCINNTKQKMLLQAAGHQLKIHNLLTEIWTAESLRPFFGDLPVTAWFNHTAPMIKSGEVVPKSLDEAAALALMVQYPLLIRRPLLRVADRYAVGFDQVEINTWIGLQPLDATQKETVESLQKQDLQSCPRQS